MRFLPHHQDTGGFFVSVLEKIAPIPREEKNVQDGKEEMNAKDEKEEIIEDIKDSKEEIDILNEVLEEKEEISEDLSKEESIDVIEDKSVDETPSQPPRPKRIKRGPEDPFYLFCDEVVPFWNVIKFAKKKLSFPMTKHIF